MSSIRQYSPDISLAGAITRYFEIALYLLVLTAFVTLASTKGLDAPSVWFVSAMLAARGYFLVSGRSLDIPERWTTVLTLSYIVFYAIDYFLLSRQFVATTVHLVLFLMVLRIFSARRDRDYYFLAVIAFLMVLAAAVLTVDSVFLFAFSIFLLFAVATFILMEMKRSSSMATTQSKEDINNPAQHRLALSLAGIAPAILLLILLAGAAIFFVLPRISTGYLSAFAPGGGVATGFSDHVDLGSIGEIQQSSAVVMHIKIDGDLRDANNMKWRGVALSLFDGKSWSNPYRPQPMRGFADQPYDIRPRAARWRSPLLTEGPLQTHYHIVMEPIGVNVFFVLPRAQALQGNYRVVATDEGGAVFNLDSERAIGSYDAWSISAPDTSISVMSAPNLTEAYSPYLQVPRLDPRIAQLAEQIASSAPERYDKAVLMERYLQTKFGYTLQLPRTRPTDPLANFLFERHEGHCEYFASAMAIMLRTQGIPSRVITGFRGGELNDLTSQYVVRAANAHAWVEAYFPERGWVSFDPTPPSSSLTHTGWARLALYMDAMASFWREWVVNYDSTHQSSLGHELAHNGRRLAEEIQAWARQKYGHMLMRTRSAANTISGSPRRWSMTAILTAAVIFFLLNIRRIWRLLRESRLAARPERAPRQAATLWYERMIRKVGRQGWRKSGAQTPSEFADSIQDIRLRERVVKFTRHYEGARFGNSAEDAHHLPDLYEEITAAKR